jgi:3-isopropylmalate/(R)-2-methylmalate dehydratase large subunit
VSPSPFPRGRVLWLAQDAELVRRQLSGEVVPLDPDGLADDVSTDEMTPAWACYYFDERLSRYCLVGLRGGAVTEGSIAAGGFEILVGGANFGCGSSRETAPYAQLVAGIRLVVAKSFARIYAQNCLNIGLSISTDFGLLGRISRGEALDSAQLVAAEGELGRSIARAGGLLAHARARVAGQVQLPAVGTSARPQTLVEKIIAAHAVTGAHGERPGVAAVSPGEALFVHADWRFSHEYVTPMADALFRRAFGEAARVAEPEHVLLFRDHLTFVEHVLAADPRRLPLLEQARLLPEVQARFAERHGVRLFGEVSEGGVSRGSEAICHELMLEAFALPGSVVVGTDSHTSTAGALGCLAFGVGSSDMAAAWLTRDVRLLVPETVRVELRGRLRPGTCAKDVMLTLFGTPLVREGKVTGRVLEFGGDGVHTLPLDERATLTNMAVEAGALTGIVEVDAHVLEEAAALRGTSAAAVGERALAPDPGADYAGEIVLDLDRVEPMLALPGDPRNVLPLSELASAPDAPRRIDIAYGGSCTGGKRADMDFYASVLAPAVARGERAAAHVALFVQLGSQRVRRYAVEHGFLEIFERAGATVLDPACGACIAAGPGVSTRASEVTVSASSRNFRGRSGPGRVILASPLVVAASALAGELAAPPAFSGAA